MKQYQMKRQQANGFAMELTADGVWVKHADHIAEMAKVEWALAQAQAEVLTLKSANEDARLNYQTLSDERDALRKRLYDQSTDMDALKLKLATADALLKSLAGETRAIADGELGSDWADQYGPLWELLNRADRRTP